MGIKDLFKKTPTKENATLGARFYEQNSAKEIFDFFQQAKAKGENVYVEYIFDDGRPVGSGTVTHKFYSLDDMTLNELDDKICILLHGVNRAEYEKREAEVKARWEKRVAEETESSTKLEDSLYKRGEAIIFPSQKENWRKCLAKRGLDNLKDFAFTVNLMEKLDKGENLHVVKDVMRTANSYNGIEMDKVLQFSKFGPEFYTEWKQISGKDMEQHAEDEEGIYQAIEEIDRRNQEEIKLAKGVASALHEDWRKTRLNEDGSYEPRWKAIKDQNFVAKLNPSQLPNNIRAVDGGYEIDIANSTYDQLSADWQYENQEAGKVVAGLVIHKQYDNASLSRQQIGDEIHNEWLKRNTWAKGGKLDVPFAKLSGEEQYKDIIQYRIADNYYKENIQRQQKFFDFGMEK